MCLSASFKVTICVALSARLSCLKEKQRPESHLLETYSAIKKYFFIAWLVSQLYIQLNLIPDRAQRHFSPYILMFNMRSVFINHEIIHRQDQVHRYSMDLLKKDSKVSKSNPLEKLKIIIPWSLIYNKISLGTPRNLIVIYIPGSI